MQSTNPKESPQYRNTASEPFSYFALWEVLSVVVIVAATVLVVAAVPVGFTPPVAVVGGGSLALFVQSRVTAVAVSPQGGRR